MLEDVKEGGWIGGRLATGSRGLSLDNADEEAELCNSMERSL
jgi:hypothetical protein